jgi:HPt (histidine-containing phosphotransfer) domain-containing protein
MKSGGQCFSATVWFGSERFVMRGQVAELKPLSLEAAAPSAEPLIDWRHFKHQTLGDAALGQEVIALFLADTPNYIAALRSANDAAEWRMAVHTLKGVALNLGAVPLARLCRSVEFLAAANGPSGRTDAISAIAKLVEETRSAIGDPVGAAIARRA